MSEVGTVQYQVGAEYRITRLLTKDPEARNHLIAYGFIPGAILKVKYRLFRGAYWVIQVHGHTIGMRSSELKRLKLYNVDTY